MRLRTLLILIIFFGGIAGGSGMATTGQQATVELTGSVPLSILEVCCVQTTPTHALIVWSTNGPSSSHVLYDTRYHADIEDYRYHVAVNILNPVADHGVWIGWLRPSTTYHYRVVSEMEGLPAAVSDDHTFRTKPRSWWPFPWFCLGGAAV